MDYVLQQLRPLQLIHIDYQWIPSATLWNCYYNPDIRGQENKVLRIYEVSLTLPEARCKPSSVAPGSKHIRNPAKYLKRNSYSYVLSHSAQVLLFCFVSTTTTPIPYWLAGVSASTYTQNDTQLAFTCFLCTSHCSNATYSNQLNPMRLGY